MTASSQVKPWDFSHVLDLVKSLSVAESASYEDPIAATRAVTSTEENGIDANAVEDVEKKGFETLPAKLGDFAKIWQFLGTPSEVLPSPKEPSPETHALPGKEDYVSDGATFFKAGEDGGAVQWLENPSADEPTADTLTDRYAPPALTKTQRKKHSRRERKAKEAVKAAEAVTVSESEADNFTRKTPARKASAHGSSGGPVKRYTLRDRDGSGKAVTAQTPEHNIDVTPEQTSEHAVQVARARVAEKLEELKSGSPSIQRFNWSSASHSLTVPATVLTTRSGTLKLNNGESVISSLIRADGSGQGDIRVKPGYVPSQDMEVYKTNAADVGKSSNTPRPLRLNSIRQPSLAATTTAPQRNVSAYNALHSRPEQQQLSPASVPHFIPSTVQPPQVPAAASFTSQALLAQNQNISATQRPHPNNLIEPTKSGEDRHWALLMKLIGDFWEDRKHLISPMNLTTHNNDPKGIHVFVDASNIFIGFTEQLKISRGIPLRTQIPPVNLSFDALALLMERRRPVAKRVLVGSTPHLPAFDKAKAVGYECSILEKVYKARELTERQIFFNERDRAHHHHRSAKAPTANSVTLFSNNHANGSSRTNGSGSGNGSGSETNAPQYAPARMIEQGVDEILHLKILESVVDTETPSTIVLATGDAAQAEYSQGFMAMVERALRKGWKVELVSWSKNISMMYSKREWVQTWGDMFKVVYLDDYAEELLDM